MRIACQFAAAGHKGDINPVSVEKVSVVGMGSMGAGIARAMIAGGLPVEAVFEDVDVKRSVLARLEGVCSAAG